MLTKEVSIIITEKPDVAKRIAYALFENIKKIQIKNVPVYISSNDFTICYIVPASGHLYDLDFDNMLSEKWEYPILPDINGYRYIPIRSKISYIRAFKEISMLLRDDSLIIIATDLDRRGSYIAMQILEAIFGINILSRRLRRMAFNALTKDELIDAYKNLKDMDVHRAYAGWCQDRLDLLWGANLTRALTWAYRHAGGKGKVILSAGRVQTPTLRLIYEREKMIEKFKSKIFYIIEAVFEINGKTFKGRLFINGSDKIEDKKIAESYLERVRNIKNGIAYVKKLKRRIKPPEPYSITSLQKDAQRLFNFKPLTTKAIAQSLYEKGLISYPRSGSTMFETKPGKHDKKYFKKLLIKLKEYNEKAVEYVIKRTNFNPSQGKFFDGAHPPIHAVDIPINIKLSSSERKLYDLIFSRTLAILCPPLIVNVTNVEIKVDNLSFKAEGISLLDAGWLTVYYKYSEFHEKKLPKISTGDIVNITDVNIIERSTRPPPRFTRASLIRTMEKLGLGTPATRDVEVEILIKRKYAEGKSSLRITPLGRAVIETLISEVPEITTPELTVKMEKMLSDVENGKLDPKSFYDKTLKDVKSIIYKFKERELEIGKRLLRAVKLTLINMKTKTSKSTKRFNKHSEW